MNLDSENFYLIDVDGVGRQVKFFTNDLIRKITGDDNFDAVLAHNGVGNKLTHLDLQIICVNICMETAIYDYYNNRLTVNIYGVSNTEEILPLVAHEIVHLICGHLFNKNDKKHLQDRIKIWNLQDSDYVDAYVDNILLPIKESLLLNVPVYSMVPKIFDIEVMLYESDCICNDSNLYASALSDYKKKGNIFYTLAYYIDYLCEWTMGTTFGYGLSDVIPLDQENSGDMGWHFFPDVDHEKVIGSD